MSDIPKLPPKSIQNPTSKNPSPSKGLKNFRKFKGDGYESIICEHHRDIVVCPDCDIFKDGYTVTFEGGWYMKFLHPITWWKFKREARWIVMSKERES